MGKANFFKIVFSIFFFLIFVSQDNANVYGESGKNVAVIVNSKVNIDNLSFAELRRILTGEKQFWAQGQRVTIIMPSLDSFEGKILLKEVYDKSEAQYRKYWIAKVFRTEIPNAPNIVKNPKIAAKVVKAVEGAISVIGLSEVPEGVKVISINNLKPLQNGYPLR